MNFAVFNEKLYNQLIVGAKYQFIVHTSKYTYYVKLPGGAYNTEDKFVAYNENLNTVEILDYVDVKMLIVDGKKYYFGKKQKQRSLF